MRSVLCILIPVLVLPPIYYVILAHPVLEKEIDRRLPLLPVYDVAGQLSAEIALADARQEGLPANYGSVVAAYSQVAAHPAMIELAALSGATEHHPLPERLVATWCLWRRKLPLDLLDADPVREIVENLKTARLKESRSAARRQEIVARHVLDCLRFRFPESDRVVRVRSGLPPGMVANGLIFCGEKLPLERTDVLRRVEYQIEYLLTDLRETTKLWLKRRDRYGEVVAAILRNEGVPVEFSVLPALESGYSASATSPSQARGWWQFVKGTALNSRTQDPKLDWTLRVSDSRDERCDLVLSTRSAAKYLTWMRSRLSDASRFAGWLTVAAAYNAGLNELQYRTGVYRTDSYWDMKLPLETENYVPRWIALWIIDSHREFYRMEVPPTAALQFETLQELRLSRDLPLSLIAVVSDSSLRFIRELNGAIQKSETAFRASSQHNEAAHTIHVPVGCKESVLKALREKAYLENEGLGSSAAMR